MWPREPCLGRGGSSAAGVRVWVAERCWWRLRTASAAAILRPRAGCYSSPAASHSPAWPGAAPPAARGCGAPPRAPATPASRQSAGGSPAVEGGRVKKAAAGWGMGAEGQQALNTAACSQPALSTARSLPRRTCSTGLSMDRAQGWYRKANTQATRVSERSTGTLPICASTADQQSSLKAGICVGWRHSGCGPREIDTRPPRACAALQQNGWPARRMQALRRSRRAPGSRRWWRG